YVNSSGTYLSARFDLTAKATGLWDVRVTNPSAQVASLPASFRIETTVPASLAAQVVGYSRFQTGRTAFMYVEPTHLGNVRRQGVALGHTWPAQSSGFRSSLKSALQYESLGRTNSLFSTPTFAPYPELIRASLDTALANLSGGYPADVAAYRSVWTPMKSG